MVEATILFKLLPIAILELYKVFEFGMLCQGHMGAPLYHSTGQVGPRFVNPGSIMELEWK